MLFQDPFSDLRNKSRVSKQKKKKQRLPPIPIEGCPISLEWVIGNKKAKEQLASFLQQEEHVACVMWGAPGVGKSSYCHLLLRHLNIWPHTIDDLFDYVKIDGKRPKLSQSMKRIVQRRMERSEVFFLDHLNSVCLNDPDEVKRIINYIYSDAFRNRGIKVIIGIDNLYSKECSVLRTLIGPYTVNKRKITAGISVRFWPLYDNEIKTLLQQQGVSTTTELNRGVTVAKGDGRQAILYSNMLKRKIKVVGNEKNQVTVCRDIVSNPFDACGSAFRGDKEQARSGGDWYVLKALIHHNVVHNLVEEPSVWGNKVDSSRQLTTLDDMARMSSVFSSIALMDDTIGEEVVLAATAAIFAPAMKNKKPACKWPETPLYLNRSMQQKYTELLPLKHILGVANTDLGTVSRLLTQKLEKEPERMMRWCHSNNIIRSSIVERSRVFD